LNLNTTLADKQIRFMYGMDHNDEWSLQKWNHHYDIILCHTTHDKELIEAKFNAKTFIMGYPRYDSFFNLDYNNPKIIDLQNEFKIDKSKKTLLWMPTLGGNISSIPIYAEHIKNYHKNILKSMRTLLAVMGLKHYKELSKKNLMFLDKNSRVHDDIDKVFGRKLDLAE
jgi:CDP-glycerol glycerophosphotransferase (TagB/SpsB family)